jgi:hypothetical protein
MTARRVLVLVVFALATLASPSASACPSEVALSINSSDYSVVINIELRQGRRPGSKVVGRDSVVTRGAVRLAGICPGTYFFAFSTPVDEVVSVTRYFEVLDDGTSYSNPSITLTYSRVSSGGQKVGSARKSEL